MKETAVLHQLIVEARQAVLSETPDRLHRATVPSDPEPIQVSYYDPKQRRWRPNYDEMVEALDSGIGKPFSNAFSRLLAHRDHYGSAYIGRESLMEVSDWCNARHPTHARPGFSMPLCGWFTHLAIRLGQEPSDIAWLTGHSEELVCDILERALQHARAWRHGELHRITGSQRVQGKVGEGQHNVICPMCHGKKVTMRKGAA